MACRTPSLVPRCLTCCVTPLLMLRQLGTISGVSVNKACPAVVGRLNDVCGIVGYVGAKPAIEVVMDGLRRLEYRGYDSAGVALVADGELFTAKRAGKLGCLEVALKEASADGALPMSTT